MASDRSDLAESDVSGGTAETERVRQMDTTGTAAAELIRVLVVDDHRTFTDLLEVAIERESGLCCVGSARGIEGAVALVRSRAVDVVIMDYQLEDGDGVAATRQVLAEHPEIRVVMLTAHAHQSLIRDAARAGVCCLLPKNGSLPELLVAIRTSSRDGFTVHPQLMRSLAVAESQVVVPSLSPREDEVLQLLARGLEVRSVASLLGIRVSTCRGYVKVLLTKLDAHSQLEAVVAAQRLGLVHADDRQPA